MSLSALFDSIPKTKEDQAKPSLQQAIENANKVLLLKEQKDEEDAKGEQPKAKNKTVKNIKKIHVEDDVENLNDLLEEDEKMEDDQKKVKLTPEERAEKESRTIFIGNVAVPETKNMKPLKKGLNAIFKKYGKIESIRFRNIGFSKETLSAKINAISGNFHAKRDSLNAYVVFTEVSSVEGALAENGTIFMGKHIRVDRATPSVNQKDVSNTAFVGNLPEDVTEEELWTLFKPIGGIANVRVVRDKTGIGKGVAFVAFNLMEQVQLAVQKNNATIRGKKIRVQAAKTKKQLERIKAEANVDHSARQLANRKRKAGNLDERAPKQKWQGDTAIKGYVPRALDKKTKKKKGPSKSKKPVITFEDTKPKPASDTNTTEQLTQKQEGKKRTHIQFDDDSNTKKDASNKPGKKESNKSPESKKQKNTTPTKLAPQKPATDKKSASHIKFDEDTKPHRPTKKQKS